MAGLRIGGAPLVTLRSASFDGPGFTEATVLPGRGMMLLQARLRLVSGEETDGLVAPAPPEAARALDGGPEDFAGNAAFSFGGAILAPYANRIRGRPVAARREIEALVDGRPVRLPRNWGGRATGAEQYAMHGLILDAAVPFDQPSAERVTGRLPAGDFGGRWPGRAELAFDWRLTDGVLRLAIEARNVGAEPLPIGLGWHPYFALPGGDRSRARLRLPAAARAEVNDYDQVLPTGRLLPTAGTRYDFRQARPLGDLYLDDCFTEIERQDGTAIVELEDPVAGHRLRIASPSPQVRAVQVFAPPDKAFVVIEPQFNLPDPYGEVWPPGTDTGMARLQPGERLTYEVAVRVLALGNRGAG